MQIRTPKKVLSDYMPKQLSHIHSSLLYTHITTHPPIHSLVMLSKIIARDCDSEPVSSQTSEVVYIQHWCNRLSHTSVMYNRYPTIPNQLHWRCVYSRGRQCQPHSQGTERAGERVVASWQNKLVVGLHQ